MRAGLGFYIWVDAFDCGTPLVDGLDRRGNRALFEFSDPRHGSAAFRGAFQRFFGISGAIRFCVYLGATCRRVVAADYDRRELFGSAAGWRGTGGIDVP